MLSCFTGFPFCSLLCQTLLGKLLFFCLFSAVKLFLTLGLFHDTGKGPLPVRMDRWFQTGKPDQVFPGVKPFCQIAPAFHLIGPWGVSVIKHPIPDQLQKLRIRVLLMRLSELLFLRLKCLRDHTADRCFINIVSSRITHNFDSLPIKKLRQS